jgi:uracil-DNA glycosylase
MATLRQALEEFARGWAADLPDGWSALLAGHGPDAAAVRADLGFDAGEPIFPARRGTVLAGARADAHVFRAFDALPAGDVRCVLLGQDPYPDIARATGRSFEQGNLAAWPERPGAVAASLRLLLQFLAHARTGETEFLGPSGWAALHRRAGELDLGTPQSLFDRWQSRGVLCLNAGLTLTRYRQGGAPEQIFGHIPFWAPLVGATLRALASRSTGAVVFLLLGRSAQGLADAMGVRAAAEAAGTWKTGVVVVGLSHPAAPGFLQGMNPFCVVDRRLAEMNQAPIGW